MSRRTNALVTATAAVTAFVAPLATTGLAHAQGGSAISKQGQCSGAATWKLSAKPDNGKIEVQWEVDSTKAGQTWSVRLHDNGNLFFSGHRTTQAPSDSFSITRFTTNLAGSDQIHAKSVHGSQVCKGSVTV